jgi:hypothetical protein
MMRKFTKMEDMLRSLDRDVVGLKSDILAAVGAELAQKIKEETGGEVIAIPVVTPDGVTMTYKSVGDEAQVERHANALKRVNAHFQENLEEILRSRNVI